MLLRQVQARALQGHHLRALRRRGHALARCGASAWATSSSPRPSRTSGTSRAFRAGSATCSTSRRRASRRSSTSRRTSITWVDTERLHKDLPKLEADVRAEIDEIRNEARAEDPRARRGVHQGARGARGPRREEERARARREGPQQGLRGHPRPLRPHRREPAPRLGHAPR